LNTHGVNDVKTEMHSAEPLVPEPISFGGWNCYWEDEKIYITRYLSNSSRRSK